MVVVIVGLLVCNLILIVVTVFAMTGTLQTLKKTEDLHSEDRNNLRADKKFTLTGAERTKAVFNKK
jgi:hypothetical protein